MFLGFILHHIHGHFFRVYFSAQIWHFSVPILGLCRKSGFTGPYIERFNACILQVSRKHVPDKHHSTSLQNC